MESYWCLKKNSIVNLIKSKEGFNPALTPCLKTECPKWDNGGGASQSVKWVNNCTNIKTVE
jgi:hypothetical protein